MRVRVTVSRGRRGEGPGVLNGHRAVVSEIAEDGRIEVTWRTRTHGTDTAFVSASLTPDQVASGVLVLGYAMTIAASQGMTCDTSLLYGHGANVFAMYPGLTRGRKANHLWLPRAVVESDDSWAQLGDALTEKERLERAVDAFARYLGQSRPDAMVSDLLHEPCGTGRRAVADPHSGRHRRNRPRPVGRTPRAAPAGSPTCRARVSADRRAGEPDGRCGGGAGARRDPRLGPPSLRRPD